VEKISKISTMWIARYELLNLHKSIFLALRKNGQHFTSSHLYEEMSKMVVILWIHFSRQVGYMLEKF